MYDDYTREELAEYYRKQSAEWHEAFLKADKRGRQLLDENQTLRTAVEAHNDSIFGWEFANQAQAKEIEQLQADKAAAVETLRWYADDKNYKLGNQTVLGKRARATLQQIGGDNKNGSH